MVGILPMRFSLFFIQKIYRVGFLLVLSLVLLDLIAFFYFPQTLLSDLFTATREQTPLTWLSALSFFFIGLAALTTYYRTQAKIWYLLAATFFFFSLDDAIYFHERVSGYLANHTFVFDFFPSYIWVLLYFPLLAFSLGALLYLLWREHLGSIKHLLLWAFVLLGAAVLLDLFDGWIEKRDAFMLCTQETCRYVLLHLIRLAEETMEVIALGLLGYILITTHCLDKEG